MIKLLKCDGLFLQDNDVRRGERSGGRETVVDKEIVKMNVIRFMYCKIREKSG